MTIVGLAYLALFTYPAITLLTPEPNYLRWLLKTGGGGTMPPDVKERWERNVGNLLIAKFLLLVAACSIYMKQIPISTKSVGLRLDQPLGVITMGAVSCAMLIWWLSTMKALALKAAPQAGFPHSLLREPRFKLLLVLVLGGFAEELWRALSLTILPEADISKLSAVLLTSLVFGVGHLFSYKSLGAALGKFMAPAIAGAFLAALFLWSHTLFIPFFAHVLINSFGANLGLKRLIARQDFGSAPH